MDAIVRLPHPWSGDSQGQEMFLAPSADKQTQSLYIYPKNRERVNTFCPGRRFAKITPKSVQSPVLGSLI